MVGRQSGGGLNDVSAKGKERRKAGRQGVKRSNLVDAESIVLENLFSVFVGQISGIFGLVVFL